MADVTQKDGEAAAAALRGQLADLLAQRRETLELAAGESDPEVEALRAELEGEIDRIAADVVRAAGVHVPTAEQLAEREKAPKSGKAPPERPMEVQWDDGTWYSCVVVGGGFDYDTGTVLVKTLILGYNVAEAVPVPKLRRWLPAVGDRAVVAGAPCKVVHPETGEWVPGKVERTTLKNTVWVNLTDPAAPAAPAATSGAASPAMPRFAPPPPPPPPPPPQMPGFGHQAPAAPVPGPDGYPSLRLQGGVGGGGGFRPLASATALGAPASSIPGFESEPIPAALAPPPPAPLPTPAGPTATPGSSVELHPSYVRCGKMYRVLKKQLVSLTEEERAAQLAAEAAKQKEKAVNRRRGREEAVLQGAAAWQSMLGRIGKPRR